MNSKLLSMILACACLPQATWALQVLSDDELSNSTGQALLSLTYSAPSGSGTGATASDYGFYKLGIQGILNLNANIKNLNLGCDGADGTGACDIKASNVSFGCITNASNICIPVSGTNTNTGVSSTAGRTGMKDFTLTNPFLQLAIKNPTSASTREFMGVRLGAEQTTGPLSFGTLSTFSGYLTATANLTLNGQTDVAITCGVTTGPCPGTRPGTGVNTFGLNAPDRSLDLDNDQACVLFLCAEFKDLTIDFDGVTRTSPVTVSGKRQTQAMISDLRLGSLNSPSGAVYEIVQSMSINRSNSTLSAGLINFVLGLIRGQARTKIVNQFATGLGTSVASLDNNTYLLPYNLSNVHELDVNSTTFGLSVQKADVQYPGYAQAVNSGWGLYLPNAFNLNIQDDVTIFTSNITNGQAAAGNIIPLQPANVNCYGSLTFC
jgi:hypothetical protein